MGRSPKSNGILLNGQQQVNHLDLHEDSSFRSGGGEFLLKEGTGAADRGIAVKLPANRVSQSVVWANLTSSRHGVRVKTALSLPLAAPVLIRNPACSGRAIP